jgi:hypothetical protein
VPSKTIAMVLNNESNLRILEKLKARPYYPRELAAEMNVSEPFIVRRLKEMEEHNIVNGQWDNEGARKVKRYYINDITMQLGRDGLKVTSIEATTNGEINMEKEAMRIALELPSIILLLYGFFANDIAVLALVLIYEAWYMINDMAIYRKYRQKNTIAVVAMLLAISTLIGIKLINILILPSEELYMVYTLIGVVFFTTFIYHIRFSQIESKNKNRYIGELIVSMDTAPLALKIFYLPIVIRWKIIEYFGLM